jgi:hypothetical protein
MLIMLYDVVIVPDLKTTGNGGDPCPPVQVIVAARQQPQ